MNTTFKVVFNKARGALMVTNEVTSCAQSKGTKTVLASAFAVALIGLSGAASATIAGSDIVDDSVRGYSVVWDSATLPDNTIKITLNKALEDEIQQVAPLKTVESYGLMIKDDATGALDNADIVSTTDDSADQSMNVALGVSGGDVTLKGATTHISATSALMGSDINNRVTALLVEGGSLNLSADKTEISATSSNKMGKVADGIEATGGRLLVGGDLTVTASSQDKNAYALYGQNSTIALSGNTTLTATANAKDAYAVYLNDHAQLTLVGQQNVLTGEVSVQNTSVFSIDGHTVIKGDLTGDGTINNNGTLEISGALGGFTGTFTMVDGNLSLTKENGYFGGKVEVNGGTLDVLNTDVTDFHGTTINRDATLLTSGERAFGVAADATDLSGLAIQYNNLSMSSGTLAIDDEHYTLDWVNSAKSALKQSLEYRSSYLFLTGSLLSSSGANTNTIKTADIVERTIMSQVHYDATEDALTDGVQRLDKTVGVQSVSLNKEARKVDITKDLILVGSEKGGELISAGDKLVEVNVRNSSSLRLDNANLSHTAGSISNTVNFSDNAQLYVKGGSFNIEHIAVSKFTQVILQGELKVNKISGNFSPYSGIHLDMFYGPKVVNLTIGSFEVEGGMVAAVYYSGRVDIVRRPDKMSTVVIERFKENTVRTYLLVSGGYLISLGDATAAAAQSLLTKSAVTLGSGTGKIYDALYIDASKGPLILENRIGVGSNTNSDHTLALHPNSILLIDAAKVKSSVFGDNTTLDFRDGAEVFVDNITKNGLLLTGKGTSLSLGDKVTFRTNDHMIKLEPVKVDPVTTEGKLEVTVVGTKEEAQITDQGVFEAIQAVYEAGRNDPNATHQADAFATRVAQGEKYFGSMAAANQAATEMRALATVAGVQSTSWDSASLFNDRVQARQSLANLSAKGTGLWADLYASRNKSESFGGGAGYEADIHGGIFGADTTLQNDLRVGAALTYVKADTDTTGTATKIKNKSDFVGVSVYGSISFDRTNVMADVTYLYGDHDVKANAGGNWGDTVKTNLFAVGVRTEWLSTYAGVNVMPHVGLRFTTLETGAYEAAFDVAKTRQNIVTLPVGVTLSADLTVRDWAVKPIADFSVIPAIGDRNVDVAFGAQQKLAVDVIESGLFNATLGLAAHEGAWTIGVNYRLGVGANKRSNNTFNANMSYAF